MKYILVPGGAGYIGSHTCLALWQAGYELVIVDNFCNSSPRVIDRLEALRGKGSPRILCERADIGDEAAMDAIFQKYNFSAVVHFAGLKAVGESVSKPLEYYQNNISGTLVLLQAMNRHGVKRIIFSSSATVYGVPQRLPLDEEHPLSCTNPYGWTKLMIEQILRDVCVSDPDFTAVMLRYFNPIGAHESGTIGEDPAGIPNNICPILTQAAIGRLPQVNITGNDYDTIDGTGVRDYIHVTDLAEGHVRAVEYAEKHTGSIAVNLGTGHGTSVLELLQAMQTASGREIPYSFAPRRPGDIAASYTSCDKARTVLGWQAKYDIDRMCADSWRWQSMNPKGYNN